MDLQTNGEGEIANLWSESGEAATDAPDSSDGRRLVLDGYTTLQSVLHHDTLNQVSILQSLSQGDFLGHVTVAELKGLGDTGIGTFNGLNGELVMLEGRVYRAAADGTVTIAADEETVPFADVTYMDNDITFDVDFPCDFAGLCSQLQAKADFANPNMFYMAVIGVHCPWIKVRSAKRRQVDNGTTLAEYMVDAERTFEYEDVSGTLVALYCPPFMSGLNMPGWHLHFLSDDRLKGGHVLDLQLDEGTAHLDQTRCFNMVLPEVDNRFADMDLTLDQSADLKKVESSK